MKKLLCVLLHILGYPVLLALVLFSNWNIITTQFKNYGIFVLVGLAVAVVMTIIYYICYLAITTKKKKTIFSQTVRLCMVVMFTMTGLWAVCDIALPDMLATATSSTVYYEDLADGWQEREIVNDQLLTKFIDLSVKEGTLPTPTDSDGIPMSSDEATKYYKAKGIKTTLSELNLDCFADSDYEAYNNIAGLFTIQYQSINANGYTTFTHPWIDCATSDRLTIPCLVHLLLDKREVNAEAITEAKYTDYNEETGEVSTVMFAVFDKETQSITFKHINWTVLDMLGTDTIVGPIELSNTVAGLLGLLDFDAIIPQILPLLQSKNLIDGAELNVFVEIDENNLLLVLRPTTGYYDDTEYERTPALNGVLGYQEMAWLDSNGLIYALVGLFSLRKIFLVFAAWGVMINILIGVTRGMGKEEKEKKKKLDDIRVPERTPAKTVSYGRY